jgi:hypothetical protein
MNKASNGKITGIAFPTRTLTEAKRKLTDELEI